jgi:uncharacterized membrane protein
MVFPFFLIVFGAIGWIASFGLTLERIKVAGDPAAATACDISPFISCKSVMLSEQAALFSFFRGKHYKVIRVRKKEKK